LTLRPSPSETSLRLFPLPRVEGANVLQRLVKVFFREGPYRDELFPPPSLSFLFPPTQCSFLSLFLFPTAPRPPHCKGSDKLDLQKLLPFLPVVLWWISFLVASRFSSRLKRDKPVLFFCLAQNGRSHLFLTSFSPSRTDFRFRKFSPFVFAIAVYRPVF